MLPTVKSLGIDQFNRDERLALVQEIWDTIAAEQVTPLLSDTQRHELQRRVAEDDAAPDDVTSWEEIKKQTLLRFRPT